MSTHTEENSTNWHPRRSRLIAQFRKEQLDAGYDALGKAIHLAACAALISHFKPPQTDLAYRGDPPRALWLALCYTEAAWACVSPVSVVGRAVRHGASEARWRVWRALSFLGYSISGIARASGRDHTTVIYGLKRLEGFVRVRKS